MDGDFRLGEWLIQPALGRASRGEKTVALRAKAMDLLVRLAREPGQVVSKERLLDDVWQTEFISESALTRVVADLRQALGDDADRPTLIETISKRGYRLIAPVTAAAGLAEERHSLDPQRPTHVSRDRGGDVAMTTSLADWLGPRFRRPSTWTALLGAVVVLSVASVVIWSVRTQKGGEAWPRIESLAVLPLANLMGSPDEEYYVAAMHDAIIGELGQINDLAVISRTSVMRYRNTTKPAPEVARELNVDALVEGSMFKAGNTVRIQLQLIRVKPVERQVWSQTYQDDLQNVLALQKRVVRAIAEHVQATPGTNIAAARPVDPRVYDAWARGWFQRNQVTEDSLRKCLDHAAAALALDSSYAPAHALTASCLSVLPLISTAFPDDAFPKAATAARRALELDDGLADAHFALGWTLATYEWDWAAAEREYRRGLDLNPNHSLGHSRFGWVLSWMGRDGEALAEVTRGQQLNPASPNETQQVAVVHYMARRYDDAILAARRAVDINPQFAFGHDRLGRAYTEKGMYDQAIAALEKAVELSGDVNHLGALARAYALSGRLADARRRLDDVLGRARRGYFPPSQIAMIYAALGQKNDALQWLEEGYRRHDGNMVTLKRLPAWDSLRDEARFQSLLDRMHFP